MSLPTHNDALNICHMLVCIACTMMFAASVLLSVGDPSPATSWRHYLPKCKDVL